MNSRKTPMLFFQSVLCDVLGTLSKITSRLRYGSVETATREMIELYQASQSPAVVNTYYDIMMKTGNYDKLKGTPLEKEAEELRRLGDYPTRNFMELYKRSPYNFENVKVFVVNMLKKRDFSQSYDAINKAGSNWPGNKEVEQLNIHHHLVRGDFSIIDTDNEYVKRVRPYYRKFQNARNAGVNVLDSLYEDIILCIMKDNVTPSIFTGLKYEILKALVNEGIRTKARGMSIKAKELLSIGDNDASRYTLMVCMINDGQNIEKELNAYAFKDKNYRIDIERKIEMAKEDARQRAQEKKEKEQREQQKKQRSQHQYQNNRNRGGGSGDDPSGYYKIMGVSKKAPKKEIKNKYHKLIREKDPDKFAVTDKRHKALTEEMMKINEAKEVLLDDQKRNLYDQGLYNNKQQQGHQFFQGGEDIQDIFKSFFGGGFDNSGFSGGRGGSRTFYFRTGGF